MRHKKLGVMTLVGALLYSLLSTTAANAQYFGNIERSIFFLDVSSSSDSKALWGGLRKSILDKIENALGAPKMPGIKSPTNPFDLSVSVINANSQLSPVIEIVSASDAERVWEFIIKKIGGGKPTSLRLEAIYADWFGSDGAYAELVREYVLGDKVADVSSSTCQQRAQQAFSRGNFMKNVDPAKRSEANRALCDVIVKVTKGIRTADSLFATQQCGKGACSDVIGAIRRAAAVTDDICRGTECGTTKPRLCIAIASDMLNNKPGITPTSPLNTLQVVKKSKSVADAEKSGRAAAENSSVKFSQKVQVRVDVIGQGASPNFPADRMSLLDAYWKGFWSSAGIAGNLQTASLDQACR